MTELSPAAQSVLDAAMQHSGPAFEPVACKMVASALRAAADQVVPEESLYGGDQRWEWERDARQSSRKKMLAIADELEGQ